MLILRAAAQAMAMAWQHGRTTGVIVEMVAAMSAGMAALMAVLSGPINGFGMTMVAAATLVTATTLA